MKYKLGNLFKISSGGTPSKSNNEYHDGGEIPWIRTGDLKDVYIYKAEVYITKLGLDNSSAKLFPPNTVLIAMYGATIGATSILKIEASSNQACAAFLPSEKVKPEYLYYYFKNNYKYIVSLGVGGAQPNISISILKELEIDIPPIIEQEKIIHILNTAKTLINSRKQQIEDCDELIKSRFVEMFGDPFINDKNWNTKELQEVVKNDCTISYGIVQTGDEQTIGIPVFRPIDIVNRVPKLEELKKTTEEISNRYKKTILKGRELLITVRANIGDTCIVGEEFKNCNVGRGIVPLRTDENVIILEFLKYLLDNASMKKDIKSKAKGITLIQLNMEDLRKINLIIPDIDMQKCFVAFAEQVDKLKLSLQKSLSAMEDNMNVLMQKAFKGELFS